MGSADRSKLTLLGRVGSAGAIAVLIAGCATSGNGGSPSPMPSPTPIVSGIPGPSVSPADIAAAGGFYLRAYRTQALPLPSLFNWLPPVTISGGEFIDGNVAVPAIYPGPAFIGPVARSITVRGIAAVIGEARKDGLLGSVRSFADGMAPGSVVCHIALTIDGRDSVLDGPCPDGAIADSVSPGSVDAFKSFWNYVTSLSFSLATEMGPSEDFTPSSMAVLLTPPAQEASGITAQETVWPLASTFATFGVPAGTNMRCGTVTGSDLAKLLPVVRASNSLTRFTDSAGARMSIQARPLVPGEPALCQ